MTIHAIKNIISHSIKHTSNRSIASVSKSIVNLAEKNKQALDLTGSNVNFIPVDKSLTSEFLKGLLKIEEKTPLETYTRIKDEMLKALGYKNPETIILEFSKSSTHSEYEIRTGKLKLGKRNISKERLIASLRHEIEHMLQFVKIYKTKGKDGFAKALLAYRKNNNIKTSENIEDIIEQINIKFYDAMAKNTSIINFDAEKYYRAMCEYKENDGSFENGYKYYNNLLEKDAYAITKKILKSLGQDCTTAADVFPANYEEMIRVLKSNNVHKYFYESILNFLETAAQIQEKVKPTGLKRFLQLYTDASNGIELADTDKHWTEKLLKKISSDNFIKEIGQKPHQQVETWLKERKYTVEDLIKDL